MRGCGCALIFGEARRGLRASAQLWIVVAVAVASMALFALWKMRTRAGGLVVYCAHDAVFAEEVLRGFEKQTGIPVSIRYDTEATKSLGLVELLIREKDAPRCDVFWNNEVLGMMDLADRGVLAPYRGQGWQRIPAPFKDPSGYWTGFAARLRMIIVNTDRQKADEASVGERIKNGPAGMAIAKPLYGTTLTHYSVLWKSWGRERLVAWHRDWRAKGGREANGNAAVKDLVASGECDLGFTDTDDYFEALDAGRPVAAIPVRLDGGTTICIPNTVGIIQGSSREAHARQLVDFLLSAETELGLARSHSRQIPLGPIPAEQLPADVRQLAEWAAKGVDLNGLAAARAECLAWLKTEYLQ